VIKRGLLISAVAAIALAPVVFLFNASSDDRTLFIECVNLTTPILNMEPDPATAGYFTNFYDTNCVGYGLATLHACIGPTIRLSWGAQTGAVYLQWSSNLINWQDIRVANIGVTQRFIAPFGDQRFFRYRLE
jgi:hypothetical protein